MKIYFVGSIHGSQEDKDWYFQIINFLKDFGTVFSEDINAPLDAPLGDKAKSVTVYERDLEWIRETDIVVAEVTTPSLEVGYEIGLAERLKKPVLCLFRKRNGNRLSPLIAGNSHIQIRQYESLLDVQEGLRDFFRYYRERRF